MKTVGIIGYGNMGSAISERIKGIYRVFVYDKDTERTKKLPKGIIAESNLKSLLDKVEIIILAVKPQDFDHALREIDGFAKDKLIISIAAGIETGSIEQELKGARVIRVMPNLPAKIGQGMSGISKGDSATGKDFNFTKKLFSRLGRVMAVKEDMMPAVTAISGSGPGFLCDLIERESKNKIEIFVKEIFIPTFTSTALDLGFTAEQAKILAATTTTGTIKFIEVGNLSPREVKKQVTSKKGTTEAGLRVLKHNIKNLTLAAKAAQKRAKELSKH